MTDISNRSAVSLFAGGGLKSIGAQAAGYELVGAVEYDAAIAAVYGQNVSPLVTVAKVEEADPRPYAGLGLLMASPVCTRASVANANGGESAVDIAAAEGVCRWLRVCRPEKFLMENVVQYRAFRSYKLIVDTLSEMGYWWTADNVNFADYGVPQSRRRLIVRASLDMVPPLPPKRTHIGWYAAIEDLLPGLEDSAFAPWQINRMNSQVRSMVLGYNTSEKEHYHGNNQIGTACKVLWLLRQNLGAETFQKWCDGVISGFEQAQILRPDLYGKGVRRKTSEGGHSGQLVPPTFSETCSAWCLRTVWEASSPGCSPQRPQPNEQRAGKFGAYLSELSHEGSQPAKSLLDLPCPPCQQRVLQQALSSFQEIWRSFIHEMQCTGNEKTADYNSCGSCGQGQNKKMGSEFFAALSQPKESASKIAFLAGVQGESGDLFREGGTPSPTITSAHDAPKYRALLVGDQTSGGGTQCSLRQAALPAMTTDTRLASKTKAWLEQGVVKALSVQCLARFQTVPDGYRWPDKKSLASTIVGNGVPCLGVQRILEAWL